MKRVFCILLLLFLTGCAPVSSPTSGSVPPTQAQPTQPTQAPTQPTQAPSEPPSSSLRENPYTPADFAVKDGYLTCLTGHSVPGIDASAYQGEIDWQAVRASGIGFAILRVGFRGYGSTGSLNADPLFDSHYTGASAAGLQTGVYFFSQAVTPEEAVEEANYVLSLLDGRAVQAVAFDWEYISPTARTANTDARTVTDCAIAFCETIRQAGLTPMIYLSPAQDLLILEELGQYLLWGAHYDGFMDCAYRLDCWQYTNTGTVPGVSGKVDINLWLPE